MVIGLWMTVNGSTRPRLSCDRSVLYAWRHCSLTSPTLSSEVKTRVSILDERYW